MESEQGLRYRLFCKNKANGKNPNLKIPNEIINIFSSYIWHKEPFKLFRLASCLESTAEVEQNNLQQEGHEHLKESNSFTAAGSKSAFKEEVPVGREFPVFTVNSAYNHDEEILGKNLESSDFSFLFGKTKFGDAIEDEWFIVYLLLQISSNNQEMVISLFDDDGDFLLIEAADCLPPEMQPETMENRVFLCAGKLHLLPPRYKGLAIGKALEVVLDSSIDTMAAPEIQQAALRRALMYPELALTLQHKAKVILPHLAAHILHKLPAIIAPAVDAFYCRDERATKVCMEMQNFSSQTMVPMTCTMTRLQYALLKSSEFIPSPKFKIPPTFNTSYVATDLGIKIASGLEILYCNYCDEQGNKRNSKAYAVFKKRLSEMGYFQGEVEGSTLYQKLEKEALDSFTSQAQEHENTYLIPQFLGLAKHGEENLVPPSRMCQKQSDSDDWLFLSPDDVDNMVHGDNEQKPLSMEDGFSSDDDDEVRSKVV